MFERGTQESQVEAGAWSASRLAGRSARLRACERRGKNARRGVAVVCHSRQLHTCRRRREHCSERRRKRPCSVHERFTRLRGVDGGVRQGTTLASAWCGVECRQGARRGVVWRENGGDVPSCLGVVSWRPVAGGLRAVGSPARKRKREDTCEESRPEAAQRNKSLKWNGSPGFCYGFYIRRLGLS